MDKETLLQEAKNLTNELILYRRVLHSNPETGFQLTKTLPYVKERLEKMGYCVAECGKSGLVTTVGHGKKVFLLRADMDALPITEEADVPFRSENGNMHACGHDLHTAMLLGAAKLLKMHESELGGTVKLMFQGAEEIFEGSRDMIENGILESPKVDAAMMIHVMSGIPIPSGTAIVSAPGIGAPAADYFQIELIGKSCHGSAPQDGIDPITAAAHILIALQEISARELSASEKAVLTIGTFHGGSAENVIADRVTMGGTIRTFNEMTREKIKHRVTVISESIAIAYRAKAVVTFGSGCPVLVNDENLSVNTENALNELLGKGNVFSTADFRSGENSGSGGGSEDFAYISQKVPSLMIALAAGEPKKGYKYSQHHPKVKFDENVLGIGSAIMVWSAMHYLGE